MRASLSRSWLPSGVARAPWPRPVRFLCQGAAAAGGTGPGSARAASQPPARGTPDNNHKVNVSGTGNARAAGPAGPPRGGNETLVTHVNGFLV